MRKQLKFSEQKQDLKCKGFPLFNLGFLQTRKWKLGKDNFHFAPEVKKNEEPVIPSIELAEQAIEYARELEMIV